MDLTERDRALINRLQDGIPIAERPFAAVAAELGMGEEAVVERLRALLDGGVLTRFGPLFNAERMGGGLTLAALSAPPDDFERVAAAVNAFPEVAHNYARDHALNMWFVVATGTPERVPAVLDAIAAATGLAVHAFPKEAEYFLDLRFDA